MTRRTLSGAMVAVCGLIVLSGCMPTMTIEEMKAMMPQKPAELANLNMFAGQWEMTSEVTIAGLDQVLKSTGTTNTTWEGDGWYLVSRGEFTMGEFDPMTAIETWTYDAHSKKYRSTWVDSMGAMGTGVGRYNPDTKTFTVRATSHGPFGKTIGKGTVRSIDDNTMEWTWTEYAMGGLFKTMEMKGTSKRQ